MADEQQTETKTDGLDAILTSAIEEHYVPDDAPVSPVAVPGAEQDGDVATDGRSRDERGRFASGTKPSDQDPQKSQPAAQPDPATAPIEPPRNYTADQKAQFSKLPREAQQWLSQTEKEREGEYTRRSQEAAEIKRTAEPLLQALGPFLPYLQQLAPITGQHPAQMVNSIMAAEYRLRTSPPVQRTDAFLELVQAYQVPPDLLLARLTGGQIPQQYLHAQQQPNQATQRQLDPVLQQQEQRLRMLEHEHHANLQRSINDQIETFRNERDEHGNLKHPDIEELKTPMAIALASGQAADLSDAYEQAMSSHRKIFERREQANKAQMDRNAAVNKARRAAPVHASPASNGSVQAKGLDAVIAGAIEKSGAFA